MNVHRLQFQGAARPRLQIFVSDLGATGVVRNAVAIANHAAGAGYQVRLLACEGGGTLSGDVDPAVDLVELLPAQATGSRRHRHRKALAEYRRQCLLWRPDIMLSAGNHGHLLSCLAWIGIPGTRILRISNDLDHRAASVPLHKRFLRSLKFRLIASLADRLILVSPRLSHHRLLGQMVHSGKASLIPNGVDIAAVRRGAAQPFCHPWLVDKAAPTVVAVGRHAPQKNLETLLRAFAHARQQRDLRLMLVGEGDDLLTARLKDLAASLGVSESVSFVPATPNPYPFMKSADVLALPSLWEGSSNVLLEAMACGTPVIAAYSAGDASEVLDGGRFGLLVDAQDERQLGDAILRQVGEQRLLPGDRVRDFDRGETLARYIDLFDRELAASRRPARDGRPDHRAVLIPARTG